MSNTAIALLREIYDEVIQGAIPNLDDPWWAAASAALAAPAQAGWCKDCNPDNCGGCATPAAPAQAGEYPELPLTKSQYGFDDTPAFSANEMRAYVDADRAARGAAQAAPASPCESTSQP